MTPNIYYKHTSEMICTDLQEVCYHRDRKRSFLSRFYILSGQKVIYQVIYQKMMWKCAQTIFARHWIGFKNFSILPRGNGLWSCHVLQSRIMREFKHRHNNLFYNIKLLPKVKYVVSSLPMKVLCMCVLHSCDIAFNFFNY